MPRSWIACFRIESISIACERARLPHLWGEPFAVAGVDQRLAAVSPECFAFGIAAGQSAQAARAMCAGLIVLSYDKDAYMRSAETIWDAIAVETSVVEPVSPEMVYAFLSGGGEDVFGRAKQLASFLSDLIMTDVRVGLAQSKLVAEQAARQDRRASPVVAVKVGYEAAAVASLPIQSLPDVDTRLLQRLEKLGVRTLGEALALPESALHREKKLRELWHALRRLALGEDGDCVRTLWPRPQVIAGHRFEDDAEGESEELILHALRRMADKVAHDLQAPARRQPARYCRTLGLLVEMLGGLHLQEVERLASPTHDAPALYATAVRLFNRMKPSLTAAPVELQITASDMDGGSQTQLTLSAIDAGSAKRERECVLESALARLWKRYGPRAVITAALLAQAKRIHLWTHTYAKLRGEKVQVITNRDGVPIRYRRFRRRGAEVSAECYEVGAIIDNWQTTDWLWGRLIERDCWRVEAAEGAVHELHHLDVEWILEAEAD